MITFDVTTRFNLGQRVTKAKGSCWTGVIVGFYSTLKLKTNEGRTSL